MTVPRYVDFQQCGHQIMEYDFKATWQGSLGYAKGAYV